MARSKQSAGILAFRTNHGGVEVLLGHPGGPFWRRKDLGAWSIPKGEYGPEEPPQTAALREFQEETGHTLTAPLLELKPCLQAGGKRVLAWAAEVDLDETALVSNTFQLEWPPTSGQLQEFPEVDRFAWFPLEEARTKILQGQLPLLDDLIAHL